MHTKQKFNLVYIFISINFFITALLPRIFEDPSIYGIGIQGFLRLLMLGVLGLSFIEDMKYNFCPLNKEPRITIAITFFFCILIIQIFLVKSKFLHLQGSVKIIFYMFCILSSLSDCLYFGKKSSHLSVKLAIWLFSAVIIFYPYIIFTSGLSLTKRLTKSMRLSFLLRAGNEDAHFIATFFPIILAKLQKKIFHPLFLLFLSITLIYNGTRSALVMLLISSILYYGISTKNKYLYAILYILLAIIFGPKIWEFFILILKREKGLIFNYKRLLKGETVGGSLSNRIILLWLPTIKYTIKNSFLFGFGSGGWELIAKKKHLLTGSTINAPHNFFVWCFINWGILGLLAFILIFQKVIKYSWSCIKNGTNIDQKKISTGIFCSWINFIAWCLISNSHAAHGWTVYILLIIMTIANKNYVLSSSSPNRKI